MHRNLEQQIITSFAERNIKPFVKDFPDYLVRINVLTITSRDTVSISKLVVRIAASVFKSLLESMLMLDFMNDEIRVHRFRPENQKSITAMMTNFNSKNHFFFDRQIVTFSRVLGPFQTFVF